MPHASLPSIDPNPLESTIVSRTLYTRRALPEPGTVVAALPEPGTVVAALPEPGTVVAVQPEPGTVVAALPEPGTVVAALPEPGTVEAALPEPGAEVAALPEQGAEEVALPEPGAEEAALLVTFNPADLRMSVKLWEETHRRGRWPMSGMRFVRRILLLLPPRRMSPIA